jgi:deoxyribodipyrimidine photo-lyase
MSTIVWLRQDLRTSDNPALTEAARRGPVLPVFILDDATPAPYRPIGAASRWWLHHSLAALEKRLGGLHLLRGDPLALLPDLVRKTGATAVFWNRRYEPGAIARDAKAKAALKASGVDVQSFNGALLNEPWDVETGSGGPYKVFTPYWRACQKHPLDAPVAAPKLKQAPAPHTGLTLGGLDLLPSRPDWAKGWTKIWQPGEAGAMARLDSFLADGLSGYSTLRDRPDLAHVSRLSPHLHWGEVSPRQLMARVARAAAEQPSLTKDADKFAAEIGWREFAHHLLFHFPQLPKRNLRAEFDAYPWQSDPAQLKAWQRGRTGYPLVDAGMRELWATGFMHNRVRMITASFLIKHLRIDWRQGEAWFWDTLVDADLANNVASWQWVAGSGADAAPYFRIFNPMSQGEKFDPNGDYVRRWCPELAGLPDKFLHAPFLAPPMVLRQAGIDLGTTYPKPIVDHMEARDAAMAGYQQVRAASTDAASDAPPAS